MDQDLIEALDTLQTQINNLRDCMHVVIDPLVERQEALEERAAHHDHAQDCADSLREEQGARPGARIGHLSRRLSEIEVRLASKPDDFGGVTSTGAPKPMKRWVLTSNNGRRALHSWGGVMWRRKEHPPVLFATKEGAALVRDLLFQPGDDVFLEEVEVVDRDGRLVEARYVS